MAAEATVITDLFGNVIEAGQKATAELLRESRRDLYHEYREGRPGAWVVKSSFGKDSTLTLNQVMLAMLDVPQEERTRHVYVVCADTGVETPGIYAHVHSESEKVKAAIERYGLPMSVHIVKRDPKDSYFVETLGRGYPLPSNGERRCTDKLKIQPQQRAVEGIDCGLVLTGVRASESDVRNRRYTDKFDEERGEYYPILWFTIEEVWEALQAPLPWGTSLPIRRIYAEATGECGFRNPKGTETKKVDACGARFGCWVCPVVQQDKSTEFMSRHHAWLEPLTRWRELHLLVYGHYEPPKTPGQTGAERSREKRKWEEVGRRVKLLTKAGYMRNKHRLNDGEGCLIIEARKYLLDELLAAEAEMNELRAEEDLPPDELIEAVEVKAILAQHVEDARLRPFLTKGMTPAQIGAAIKQIIADVEAEMEMPYDPNTHNLFTA